MLHGDSWPATKAWRPVGGGTATPSAGAVMRCGVGEKRRGGGRGVGRVLFPSASLTYSRASRRTPSRPTPTWRLWVTGSPQRLPLGTQSVCFRLDHNAELACRDPSPHHCIEGHTWKVAVYQFTKDAEDTRILERNRKEQERRVGPTSHATVLLMPTQKFMCSML